MNTPTLAAGSPPGPKAAPPARKPQAPPEEPRDSFAYKATRTLVGGLSATAGAAVGAVVGGFKNVGAHQTQPPGKLRRIAVYAGAIAVAGSAITAGVMTGGLAGLAIAALGANPIVAGGLSVGLLEGSVDALKGSVGGGRSGGDLGWRIATGAIDWVAGKHPAKPEDPRPDQPKA